MLQVAINAGVKQLNDLKISQTARFLGFSEAKHLGIYRQDQLFQLYVWMAPFLKCAMGQEKNKKEATEQKPKPWKVTIGNSNEDKEPKLGKFHKFFFLC